MPAVSGDFLRKGWARAWVVGGLMGVFQPEATRAGLMRLANAQTRARAVEVTSADTLRQCKIGVTVGEE